MDYNISYRKKDKGIQAIISYKDHTGKWRQKSKQGFKKQRDAKRYADKMLEELKKSFELRKNIDLEYEGITFKELVKIFTKQKELQNEYTTVNNIGFSVKKFEKLNDMKVEDIKPLHIQDCVNDMIKEGLMISTIKEYLSKIRAIFNFAINQYDIISKSPVRKILIPEEKREEKKKALNKSELKELLTKITYEKFYIATLIASNCGLRAGEILGLTWDCVDLKNGILTVNKQWKKLSAGKWGLGPVKRKNSNRDVPIPPHVIKELKKFKKKEITDINNRVILYADTVNFSKQISVYYKRIGFDISLHNLRHTYATMLIANGVDFKTAAKLLGHDVEMTLKTYSHVNDDMMNKATNVVNSIFK